jgi:bacillithiol system protein YtxJ
MSWFSTTKSTELFPWIELSTMNQLAQLLASSSETPVLFFKHSTRCSISDMAKRRFEKNWNKETACTLVYLDLIAHRDISNALAQELHVTHQSPQVIVVKNGLVIHHASHNGIDALSILETL